MSALTQELKTVRESFEAMDDKDAKQTDLCRQMSGRVRTALDNLKQKEEGERDADVGAETSRLEGIEDELNSNTDINTRKLTHCVADLAEVDQEIGHIENQIKEETQDTHVRVTRRVCFERVVCLGCTSGLPRVPSHTRVFVGVW